MLANVFFTLCPNAQLNNFWYSTIKRKKGEQLPRGITWKICSKQEIAGASPPERVTWSVFSSPSYVD